MIVQPFSFYFFDACANYWKKNVTLHQVTIESTTFLQHFLNKFKMIRTGVRSMIHLFVFFNYITRKRHASLLFLKQQKKKNLAKFKFNFFYSHCDLLQIKIYTNNLKTIV
jgi:hypothetical protein